jgi:hypothetical protein
MPSLRRVVNPELTLPVVLVLVVLADDVPASDPTPFSLSRACFCLSFCCFRFKPCSRLMMMSRILGRYFSRLSTLAS